MEKEKRHTFNEGELALAKWGSAIWRQVRIFKVIHGASSTSVRFRWLEGTRIGKFTYYNLVDDEHTHRWMRHIDD